MMQGEADPVVALNGDELRYRRARQQVEETQGNVFREKAWWQLVTIILMLIVLALIIGVIYVGASRRYDVSFVVRDEHGQFRLVGWHDYRLTDEEVKRDLLMWLRCVRGLPTDLPTLERCWQIVPRFLVAGTPAHAVVRQYYTELQPRKLLFQKSIDLPRMKAFKHPDGRWQVEWQEDHYRLPRGGGEGRVEQSVTMQAILLVDRRHPESRKDVEVQGEPVNPLGLVITQLAWSE